MPKTTDPGQQKEEFRLTLSKFAHEIRNPLSLLQSELQMMADAHPEITYYEEWEDIIENIEYMRDLLNELTCYSNAKQIRPKPADPADLIKSVTDSARPALEYLGVVLETEIPVSLPLIPLDPVKIRQALLNLLRNAQESIDHPGGWIKVKAAALPEGLSISVADNGCGMTPAQQQDIFRPFVTYKSGGTGLGLPVTLQIIEAHNGSISVESTPGEGTVFQILLRG